MAGHRTRGGNSNQTQPHGGSKAIHRYSFQPCKRWEQIAWPFVQQRIIHKYPGFTMQTTTVLPPGIP